MGLFLTEKVKSREAMEAIDDIKSQGGLAIIPHPYKRAKRVEKEILKNIDGIEIFNARVSFSKNKMAQKLAFNQKLPMTAGSDAYFYFEIGRGICVFKDVSSPEDIRKAIVRREMGIRGTRSSPYIESLSQIIRSIKTKNPKLLITNVLIGSIFISYQIFKEKVIR